MGTLLKFYEDISLNVTADKSHKNFHLIVPNSLFTAEVFKKQFSIETFSCQGRGAFIQLTLWMSFGGNCNWKIEKWPERSCSLRNVVKMKWQCLKKMRIIFTFSHSHKMRIIFTSLPVKRWKAGSIKSAQGVFARKLLMLTSAQKDRVSLWPATKVITSSMYLSS